MDSSCRTNTVMIHDRSYRNLGFFGEASLCGILQLFASLFGRPPFLIKSAAALSDANVFQVKGLGLFARRSQQMMLFVVHVWVKDSLGPPPFDRRGLHLASDVVLFGLNPPARPFLIEK